MVTASWCYLRLHEGRAGPGYGDRGLAEWVDRLHRLYGDELDGYVYFDNDTKEYAVRDAQAVTCRRAGFAVADPAT